jgi:bifunctional non-homologous end joining protein LigD
MSLPSVTLEFREGTSDKVYKAAVEESGGGYVVNFAFGRRGSTLNTGTKTSSPVPLDEATKVYDKLVLSKTAKGYKPVGSGGGIAASVVAAVTDRDQRDTGLYPQLLTPITEDEAVAYLTDNDWCAQEKFDGKRMTLRKTTYDVLAANKKGLSIGFPDAIRAAVDAFMSSFVADGEAIGDRLHAFDLLELNGCDLRPMPYRERLEHLKEMLGEAGKAVAVAKTAVGTAAKRKLMEELKAAKKEGVVFKRLSAPWSAGRPASGGPAVKCKFYKTASVIVLSVNAKRSVAIGVLDGEDVVPVGNVTIGPNKDVPSTGSLIEVRYLYAYKGGSLYQPTYLEDRSDELDRGECVIGQLAYKPDED